MKIKSFFIASCFFVLAASANRQMFAASATDDKSIRPFHVKIPQKDVFTPTGRVKMGVIWDLSVRKIDNKTCAGRVQITAVA